MAIGLPEKMSADEAVKIIQSGDRVYIGTCSSMAYCLCEALDKRMDELENVVVMCSQYFRPTRFFSEEGRGHFCSSSYFMGPAERNGMAAGTATYTSFHLSQVDIWCREIAKPDVAFLEVSLPDKNGYMSYGASGVALHSYIKEAAKTIILQINPQVPYVLGEEHLIHMSEADIIVEAEDVLPELADVPFNGTIMAISDYILDQIPDGATIQLGLGGLAGAVGYGLKEKNDLGLHSELMTDSMMYLMKNGNINNRYKTYMPGKSVASFAFGSRALYDFIDHNEDCYFAPFTKVNDPSIIARNDRMISVNTAMAIDVFGQVAADAIGYHQQSATGGQLDFVRGAQQSKEGKSFIAITASFMNKKGEKCSRITCALPPGTAVTTPRSDVQYIVTEYGCVNLKHLTMRDRVKAMISLADPDFRQELTKEAKKAGIF